jgi:hypothetical protein
MLYKCECCGIEQEFDNSAKAFNTGWDVPPRFLYTTCNLCPGVCIVMNAPHGKAHALWAKEGRPPTFGIKCFTDDRWRLHDE